MNETMDQAAPRARWKVITITIAAVLLMAIIAGFVVVRVLQVGVKHRYDQIEQDFGK